MITIQEFTFKKTIHCLLGMLNMMITIHYSFRNFQIPLFARYAKYDDYYTKIETPSLCSLFARYAKYDDYYTIKFINFALIMFARYAKYDDYYTLNDNVVFSLCLLGMLNMMITIPKLMYKKLFNVC